MHKGSDLYQIAHKQIAHNHAQRLRFISSLPYQIAHKWNRLHPSAQICPQVHRLHTSRPSHFSFPSAHKWNRLHPNQVKHKFHIPHMLHNASTKILQVLRFTASSHKKASLTTRLTRKQVNKLHYKQASQRSRLHKLKHKQLFALNQYHKWSLYIGRVCRLHGGVIKTEAIWLD